MLWLAYLVLTAVFYTVNSQQGQNYYFTGSDNREQSRFAPLQQQSQHFTSGQQSFYFPQTNAGPFLPFRTASTYHLDGSNSVASSQKYQTPFAPSQPAAETHSDPRYDPLISSPGAAYGEHDETSYPDSVPEVPSQRFNSVSQDRQSSPFRSTSLASRFPSVAISEVTRTQDNPNNPSVLQTHSFNVHHTSHPTASRHTADDELPLNQNHRWRSQTSSDHDTPFTFRARNLPFPNFSSNKPAQIDTSTEDLFPKYSNRFATKEQTFLLNTPRPDSAESLELQPESDPYSQPDAYSPLERKKESKTKNNAPGHRAKTQSNILPTTYSPAVLYESRARNTLPTTTTEFLSDVVTTIRPFTIPRSSSNNRGRNKYNRPTNEGDKVAKVTSKARASNSPVRVTALASTVSPVSSNFDVVTMSQDHIFVSEDNFKGFVDSAVIDSTETPTTEDLKDALEDATVASVPTTHAPVKKKVLPPAEPKTTTEEHLYKETTTERTRKSTSPATSTTTEAWVVVASVMTSRSVSGARFIPSSAIKQDQIPVAADIKSIKDVKENRSHVVKSSDRDSARSESVVVSKSSAKNNTTAKPSLSQSTESIIDKLDQVQSELSSGILNAFPSAEKSSLDMPTFSSTTRSTDTTSTTEPSSRETYPRRFVPSAKTTAKPNFDRNKSLFDNAPPTDDLTVPASKPRNSSARNSTSSRTTKSHEPVSTVLTTTPPSSTTVNDKSYRKDNKYKSSSSTAKYKVRFDDVSAFLPAGYKLPPEETSSEEPDQSKSKPTIVSTKYKVKFDDVSTFLPAGFKATGEDTNSSTSSAEEKSSSPTASAFEKIPSSILSKVKPVDVSAFLPPEFKLQSSTENSSIDVASSEQATESPAKTTSSPKVVFASRPGGAKKPQTSAPKNATTSPPKSNIPSYQIPVIQKGWPKRQPAREFTGWSTAAPSTISIKELLLAAQNAAATSTEAETSTASTTSTTTPSTTTRRATTPGICTNDCELAGSIRLVGGVQWTPALLDHNTIEWKTLAKDLENELQKIFQSSEMLSKWYRKISIDAFSPGSVIVDYFIELSELGKTVNTAEMRRFFHEILVQESITSGTFISPTNDNDFRQLRLGKYMVDPTYTDFVVLPRTVMPAVRMTEQETWIPQWAFAVIVIGLASLIFVIVFGITVIISRRTKAKKHPTALTEEMLNELNKSHMGGFDNYGADDLYNMEDVWNEKPFKHKRSSYYQDSGTQDIYDSWRSNWDHPVQYGSNVYNSSLRSGYSRRRPDYDTNF